jgi:mandelate racemase
MSPGTTSRPPLTIRELRVRALQVTMPQPHRTASGTISESPLIVTQVITDQGVIGSSLIFTYTAAALKPCADLIANLEPLISGEPVAPQPIHDRLLAAFRLLGPQGLTGMAIAAIDMALWDAVARYHKLPLCRLLGGIEQPIPAYGAVGYDGAVLCARTAERWAEKGIRGIKAKIGYPTVTEDIEVVRAIRSAVGPEFAIMADYNQSLTPTEAIERCRHLDDEGLTWIEEPTLSHDFTGHATIAREIRTPIQAGENWWGTLDFRHAIQAASTDLLMIDVMKAGGVTGWMRVAALASAHGFRVSNHLWPEISTHLLAVTPGAYWLEYADWWNPVMQSPVELKNGFAEPGSLEISEQAIERWEV